MKMLMLIALFMIIGQAHAAADTDPNYCHGDDVCETGKWNPTETNVLRARGYGKSSMAAVRNSERAFKRAFPNQPRSCGMYTGPYQFGTYNLGDGTYASWTICPLRQGSGYTAKPRPRCGQLFGVWICR